jgi:hypothetical protein
LTAHDGVEEDPKENVIGQGGGKDDLLCEADPGDLGPETEEINPVGDAEGSIADDRPPEESEFSELEPGPNDRPERNKG